MVYRAYTVCLAKSAVSCGLHKKVLQEHIGRYAPVGFDFFYHFVKAASLNAKTRFASFLHLDG